MTYPHNFVDSKVNNQLELNDVSRIMESNPQEQFQTFWDSQGSFNFQTDEESLQAFQVHSRRCHRCLSYQIMGTWIYCWLYYIGG